MITLTTAYPEDFDQIYQVEQRSYAIPWTKQVMTDVLSSPYLNFKALHNGVLVGYIFLMKILDEATILNITVDPNYQNKGYGTIILNQSIEILKKEGVHMLFLEVRISNLVAQSLYGKTGFNQIDIRKNYYTTKTGREDAIIMAMMI